METALSGSQFSNGDFNTKETKANYILQELLPMEKISDENKTGLFWCKELRNECLLVMKEGVANHQSVKWMTTLCRKGNVLWQTAFENLNNRTGSSLLKLAVQEIGHQ
jgi:hypothetical protein